jgi:hypothetical protein
VNIEAESEREIDIEFVKEELFGQFEDAGSFRLFHE